MQQPPAGLPEQAAGKPVDVNRCPLGGRKDIEGRIQCGRLELGPDDARHARSLAGIHRPGHSLQLCYPDADKGLQYFAFTADVQTSGDSLTNRKPHCPASEQ